MTEFWTKDSAAILGGGAQTAEKEDCVDFATFESIVGKEYTIAMSKFSWGGALGSDPAVKLSDFVLVYEGDPNATPDDPGEIVENAPAKLPTTNAVYTPIMINTAYVLKGDGSSTFNRWQGGDMKISLTKDKWLTTEGFMFKFDTSKVSDVNKEMMGLALQFTVGGGKQYLETDEELIPTGRMIPVANTPFDFTKPRRVGEQINAVNRDLRIAGGYDHCFNFKGGATDEPTCRATLYCPVTGREMQVITNQPCVQVYSGNFMTNSKYPFKGGFTQHKQNALCLETERMPDSMNHEGFTKCTLDVGEKYDSPTIYKFSVKE